MVALYTSKMENDKDMAQNAKMLDFTQNVSISAEALVFLLQLLLKRKEKRGNKGKDDYCNERRTPLSNAASFLMN